MRSYKIFTVAFVFFALAPSVFAWGGPEHCSITAAAVSALPAWITLFLGKEAVRLVKFYCQYPDINWAVYGACCGGMKNGQVRLPDDRRDFNAPFYCDFDEFTGTGRYRGHGPESGKGDAPPPDEHSRKMYERSEFGAVNVRNFFLKASGAMTAGKFFDAVRLAGVAAHYLEDGTPPPHALGIPGGRNHLHHDMEAMSDHSKINIAGYQPRTLGETPETAAAKAETLAVETALLAKEAALRQIKLLELGDKAAAENIVADCANMAARAAADMLLTLCALHKDSLPVIPEQKPGVNLLFNPSFDEDSDGDCLPEGWVREWGDLTCPFDMHLLDRVSPEKGACARLYSIPSGGAVWRTSRAFAVPAKPGALYKLSGRIRPQNDSSGENYIAIRFQGADCETVAELKSEIVQADCPWREISVSAVVPEGAVDMLAVCGARNNPGAVLFDDMSLVLV